MKSQNDATSRFKSSLLDKEEFTYTYELVPGRGSGGKKINKLLEFAEHAKEDGRIRALSITDNPGGHPALSPTALGLDVKSMGLEPLIHFSLKDKNRNMAESQLFECHRHHLTSLLVLGGDYPRYGFHGQAMPVFDLDSPQLLTMIDSLRHRPVLEKSVPGGGLQLPAMDFFTGCVVSPFKKTKAEQLLQYAKLEMKIAAGANFIVTQLGYDLKKYQELLLFCKEKKISIPVLANVFIPNKTVAKIMHDQKVPGVIFPTSLFNLISHESSNSVDKGETRLVRAAKMISCLKGMGYDGIHLGGNNLDFGQVSFVFDKAKEFSSSWQAILEEINHPVPNTWYMFKDDKPAKKKRFSIYFFFNNLVHNIFFTQDGSCFSLFKDFSLFCSQKKILYNIYVFFEHLIKKILFRCRMCGDCTLAESGYLCPQSGCPKRMINGPCGGSINSYCEVYPNERTCFWVKVYEKLPAEGYDNLRICPMLPPKNWALAGSSSWINFFSGKDHTGEKK